MNERTGRNCACFTPITGEEQEARSAAKKGFALRRKGAIGKNF
jgi:hypothetical protein